MDRTGWASDKEILFPSGWEQDHATSKDGAPVFHLGLHIKSLVQHTKGRWNELPGDPKAPHHSFCFDTLRDLAEIADVGINREFLAEAAEEKRWNKDALEAKGKARPTLYLDAEFTRPGNLIMRVRRDAAEWTDWPDCRPGPYERAYNELAFVRGARFLFRDWEDNDRWENPVVRLLTRESGFLLWATFEQCRTEVEKNFEVGFQTKIEPLRSNEGGMPDRLRIVSFDELRERERRQEHNHRAIYGDCQPGRALPDLSKLYAATPDELRKANATSSLALLERTNKLLWQFGAAAIDKSRWPTTRQKFVSLRVFKDSLEVRARREERGR